MHKKSLAVLAFAFIAQAACAAGRVELPVTAGVANYDQEGFISIAGAVSNGSTDWVCAPRIDVELLDAQGRPIGVRSIFTAAKQDAGLDDADGVYAERIFVPPGEVAVFQYWRDKSKLKGVKPASHRLKASAGECPTPRTTMEVLELKTGHDQDGYYRVRGVLRNSGKGACRSPRAVVGLYDAVGKLAKAAEETPDAFFQKVLRPGQSVPFEFRSADDGKRIGKAQVWGDCNYPD
jgi:hypothetical protein